MLDVFKSNKNIGSTFYWRRPGIFIVTFEYTQYIIPWTCLYHWVCFSHEEFVLLYHLNVHVEDPKLSILSECGDPDSAVTTSESVLSKFVIS